MYETLRIVEQIKPKYVIWENVKNILSVRHKHNFDNYINQMNDLGYNSHYKVLNAKDYGLPQNRERVFTISIRKDIIDNFTFPETQPLKVKLQDMLEQNVDSKYFQICNSMLEALKNNKVKEITNSEYCSTITTKQMRWNNAGLLKQNGKLRYLTPLECWRLMGFQDSDFEKAKSIPTSDTQLYKQAGNSICVPVLVAIFNKMFL